MALLYLDTSALVKIYVEERGSERVKELALSDVGNRLAICSVAQVEFHSAIGRKRNDKKDDLDDGAAKQVAALFDSHLRTKFLRLPVDDWTLNLASDLAFRHPLRAYDAVQLAACLVLLRLSARDDLTFVSADRRLLTAARAEGLAVLNPESES